MQKRKMLLNRGDEEQEEEERDVRIKSEDKVETKEEMMIMIPRERERVPAILQSGKPVMVAFNPVAW